LVTVELDDQEQRDIGHKARAAVLDAVRALGGEGTRREILQRALRDGGFTERELSAAPPTNVSDKHENFVAYRLSWTLTNPKRDGLLVSDLPRTRPALDHRSSRRRGRPLTLRR
jgi:hypothetical protein